AVIEYLGLTAAQLNVLQTLPFAQLIAAIGPAQKMVGPPPYSLFDRYDFGPVVEGSVLPAHPFEPGAPAVSADVPVLVGGVKDEMAIYLAPEEKIWERTLSEEEMRARIGRVAGLATDRVIATYRTLYP